MKPTVGQKVLYKSKGNVYGHPPGTLVPATIESLVLRPGSNIVLPDNPVNLRVHAEYSFVITGVKQGDGVGEWTEDDSATDEGTQGEESAPLDRVEQIVQTLKKHGIHVDPLVNEAAPADRIEGSPVPVADPEAAARISADKDRKIEELQNQNAELIKQRDELQDKIVNMGNSINGPDHLGS